MHVAPRLSARYVVHPLWLVLRGSAGLHVQYLHRLRDRYSLAYDLVSSRWVPASNRVQPATGLQLGWGARSQPLPSLTMEVNTYFRGVRDMLVPVDAFQQKDDIQGPGIEVGALLGQYTTGEERAFGVERDGGDEGAEWIPHHGAGGPVSDWGSGGGGRDQLSVPAPREQ